MGDLIISQDPSAKLYTPEVQLKPKIFGALPTLSLLPLADG